MKLTFGTLTIEADTIESFDAILERIPRVYEAIKHAPAVSIAEPAPSNASGITRRRRTKAEIADDNERIAQGLPAKTWEEIQAGRAANGTSGEETGETFNEDIDLSEVPV